MTRPLFILTILVALPCLATPWDDYAPYARNLPAIDPTPSGESHMGEIESGRFVQLRFPVPTDLPLGYRVNLGSMVAYSGKGQSYQLVIRADRADGPVTYEGPVIQDGDAWNASNREPVDITSVLKPEHVKQGYIDIFITGLVTGDGWTIYKHNPGRQIVAQAVVLTAEMRRQIEMGRQMAARGIAIIPQPQQCELREGDVTLKGFGEAKTAQEKFLQAEINDRAGELGQTLQPKKTGNVLLFRADDPTTLPRLRMLGVKPSSGHPQGYTLTVSETLVIVAGDDEAGLFYGVQTLRQLLCVRDGNLVVPRLQITDYPAYPLRGWQYDVARGQTINLDFCKRLVRESARHKMNCLMLYMEGDFKFEKYPFVGREGTFDKQKAQALDEYAAQYHLQLIPQYEALGHASATLKHEELKDLRENGSPWVYCTSEPKTWQFLDDVFAELAVAFPNSKYFHVGADEFEGGFALCPRCKPKGVGPLYVEHMTKLNDICKKYGRKMLFWPSHAGPTEELSYLSLKHAAQMPKDCIPTEWIYHGPATYPEIEQYQKAGYEDVFVSPAVVDYSVIWPDYPTTFRGIKGFYDAGAERKCGGAICTTWELMYGGLYENSWYGIIYAGECGWSLGKTSKGDYDRRFAADWFGINDPGAADLIAKAFYEPIPATGDAAMWRNGKLIKDLFWCPPQTFRRQYMQREPVYLKNRLALMHASAAWSEAVGAIRRSKPRNADTARFAGLAANMYLFVGDRLRLFALAAQEYDQARLAVAAGDVEAAQTKLASATQRLSLMAEAVTSLFQRDFQYAIDNMGAYKGDLDSLNKQVEGCQAMAAKLEDLAAQVKAGLLRELPPAEDLGLGLKQYTRIARWEPSQMSEQDKELRFDITPFIKAPGTYRLEWDYTHGAHAMAMRDVLLLANGQVVAEDKHRGQTGASDSGNSFVLTLPQHDPNAKYELAATISSSGGTDSAGDVWMSVD